ncbi:MAG: hypothetical protein HQK83_16445 [Fibrobacteria bacterium]|nr:hypothetical protein [Fibrobacteria bacterium]
MKLIYVFTLLLLLTGKNSQALSDHNDANKSKLFTIGETGETCNKGTGYAKLGLNMVLPTLNLNYAFFNNWEFDFFAIGVPTLKNEEKKEEVGLNIMRYGFKHHALAHKKFSFVEDYNLSWGLKLHRFKILLKQQDTTKIDKNSWLLIPYLAQSFKKGNFLYHLYFSVPLGGEKNDAVGVEENENLTVIFVSGLEYDVSKKVKLLMEYWYTNLGGFVNFSVSSDQEFSEMYNPDNRFISYMFLGTRLSPFKRFYTELGISTHYSLPPFPFTGIILNFGWYFR